MKPVSAKESNYSLQHADNYYTDLTVDVTDICDKLCELFLDYYKFITENVSLKKPNLAKFIVDRGLDTMIHVFQHLLLYTKNVDLTYFHSQKAFYFYVEFVGQISEDEKLFLQLTSRDATMYVYKKTIYEISHEMRKLHGEVLSHTTRSKLDHVHAHIELCKVLLLKMAPKTSVLALEKVYDKVAIFEGTELLHALGDVASKLAEKVEDANLFYNIILTLAKKTKKNPNLVHMVNDKVLNEEFLEKITELSPDKFIHWLTTPN